MLKYSRLLRTLKPLITDRAFVRPLGEGPAAEAALDLIMETVSVLDYDCDYLPGAEFSKVVNDSRQTDCASVFVAIPGTVADGHQFIPLALTAGTQVIISERSAAAELVPGSVNLIVSNSSLAYAMLCDAAWDDPAAAMSGIAVTGTNGKTTTAMLIRTLLSQARQTCGLISTVEYDTGNGQIIPADRTTPEAARLFELFARMRKHQLQYFVMEVSSHALHQHRIGTLKFRAAIFTNLTGDHLDYHHNMEEYYQAKRKLFTEHLAPNGVAVINCDDRYGLRLSQETAHNRPITFGRSSGVWRIEDIDLQRSGSSFVLNNGHIRQKIQSNLHGLHNVYNLTGTVLALDALSILPLAESAQILQQTAIAVPGRLEAITLANGATAFVDYAHTHDALSNVLQTLRALNFRRIITVFGAGGDRDRSKRPLMGQAAAGLSDVIVLTSDNPRSENPGNIISEIRAGIPDSYPELYLEEDRKQAIIMAIKMAAAGDAILIAGKGHENYQIIHDRTLHLDDREIVREFQA